MASNTAAAEKLFDIVNGKVKCAVFYGRSGNASVETLKEILRSGEIGKLSLYKEDWLHHYPWELSALLPSTCWETGSQYKATCNDELTHHL